MRATSTLAGPLGLEDGLKIITSETI
jgi:hypothetical protein